MMEEFQATLGKVRSMGFRITAYVGARLFRRDLRSEFDRLENQPRGKSYLEMTVVFGILFALSLLAASFGWIGLGLYFAAIMVLFY